MKTRKKFPAYDIKSPKYPSLPILYDNLAFQDATFQSNHIILDFFATYISENKIDGKTFIKALAKKSKISAGTEDINRIREVMAQSYIVQTYNIAELFFKEFNKVFQLIHKINKWETSEKVGTSDKKLDPLNQLIKNLDTTKANKLKKLPEYILCDYYRLLRNGYVHREIKETNYLKKPTDFFSKSVTIHQKHFDKYYNFLPPTGAPAPNTPKKVMFQDFILYSRALRNLANYINELCNFNVTQALELAEKDAKFLVTPKRINYHKFPNSKRKLDLYLTNYYTFKFGDSKSQITEFLKLFYQKY